MTVVQAAPPMPFSYPVTERRIARIENALNGIVGKHLDEALAEENYHEIDQEVEGLAVKGFESRIILPKSKREYINQIIYFQKQAEENAFTEGKIEGRKSNKDYMMIGYVIGVVAATFILVPLIHALKNERNFYYGRFIDSLDVIETLKSAAAGAIGVNTSE